MKRPQPSAERRTVAASASVSAGEQDHDSERCHDSYQGSEQRGRRASGSAEDCVGRTELRVMTTTTRT